LVYLVRELSQLMMMMMMMLVALAAAVVMMMMAAPRWYPLAHYQVPFPFPLLFPFHSYREGAVSV
jgi:hypothetical protein